jgi:chemotaxis protein MotB
VDVKKEGEKINVAEINNKIFSKIESQIDNLIQDSQGIQKNISYKNTLNGLEITINDQDKRPLFQIGSAVLTDYTKNLLDNIIKFSPNLIQISGYTDKSNQSPLVKYGDWELSSDRADSARRYLLIKGISPERIHSLIARADTDLIDQDNPYSPINRRITITLLRKEGAANYKVATPID